MSDPRYERVLSAVAEQHGIPRLILRDAYMAWWNNDREDSVDFSTEMLVAMHALHRRSRAIEPHDFVGQASSASTNPGGPDVP